MAGIVFLKTGNLSEIVRFYTEDVGMTLWLKQPDIDILKHGNMLIGFQSDVESDERAGGARSGEALVTFFYPTRHEVDEMYRRFKHRATTTVQENKRYRIYNFFARDPEGRRIEFQCFLHELPPV